MFLKIFLELKIKILLSDKFIIAEKLRTTHLCNLPHSNLRFSWRGNIKYLFPENSEIRDIFVSLYKAL